MHSSRDFWLAGDWLHHTDPALSGSYYVGNDQRIYDAHGNATGYELKTQTYISGPAGVFLIDEFGNVGGDIPFADMAGGEARLPGKLNQRSFAVP